MKKIDINHENLANDKLKVKKLWKKPEMKVLDINKTYNDPNGINLDGSLPGSETSAG